MSPFQYLHTGLPFVTAGHPVCATRDKTREGNICKALSAVSASDAVRAETTNE